MNKVKKRVFLTLKWIAVALLLLLVLAVAVVLAARLVTWLSNRVSGENGVDESIYVELGGQQQFVRIRGEAVGNPVIIYLHGGPAGPDGYAAYYWQKHLLKDYTVINWDQRGCGRTYYRNVKTDPENKTATFGQALEDLRQLVDYASERFKQEKVILVGHSYGTLLGSQYALRYPERVAAYVGVGQFVTMEGDLYSYEDALQRARERGDDTAAMEEAFRVYTENGPSDFMAMMALRGFTAPYHKAPREASDARHLWTGAASPYMWFDDLRWYLKPFLDLEGCGHYPQMDDPEAFCEVLREALEGVYTSF